MTNKKHNFTFLHKSLFTSFSPSFSSPHRAASRRSWDWKYWIVESDALIHRVRSTSRRLKCSNSPCSHHNSPVSLNEIDENETSNSSQFQRRELPPHNWNQSHFNTPPHVQCWYTTVPNSKYDFRQPTARNQYQMTRNPKLNFHASRIKTPVTRNS
jgi:hypothetical protein